MSCSRWDSNNVYLSRHLKSFFYFRIWSKKRACTQWIAALESIILYQTRPSIPLLPVICTQLSDLGHRRGKRTGQEKVMMFVMSLSVDSSLVAAKSLDSHSQAISHTQCGPHKLVEGLLGSVDALIWSCFYHQINQPCTFHSLNL